MLKKVALTAFLCAPFLSAFSADYVPPSAETSADTIKLRLGVDLHTLKQPSVMITLFGSLESVNLVAADNQNLTVKFKDKNFDQPFNKIAPAEIVTVAEACFAADTQGMLAEIDYAFGTGQLTRAHDLIESNLKKTPAPAPAIKQNLEDRMAFWKIKTAPPRSAPLNAMSVQTGTPSGATAPLAQTGMPASSESVSLTPLAAPSKLAFTPSQPGQLRPVKEVAAALDNAIEIDLAEMGIRPEAVCDDPAFLRRASLDLTGQIPTPEEVIAFYNESNSSKRDKKIEELLKRPEYADRWATFWEVLLVGRHTRDNSEVDTGELKTWLRDQFAKNEPYDKMVTELLTASGDNDKNGPVNYLTYHLADTLPNTMAHLSQTFLGARIGCAQCHDHPFDKWTQDDFWSFSAFLANTRSDGKELREDPKDPKKVTRSWHVLTDQKDRNGDGRYSPPRPELLLPPRGLDSPVFNPASLAQKDEKKDAPKLEAKLVKADAKDGKGMEKPGMAMGMGMGGMMGGGGAGEGTTGQLYRRGLAAWITSEKNEKFAQSVVNRLWREMFGYGLVEPVDDIRPKNPPSHPAVMSTLAADFNASGRDLKRLMAIIVSTKAYQRSSNGGATKVDRMKAVRNAARAEVRPMSPEMLFTAIIKACGGEEKSKALMEGLRKRDQADMDKKNLVVDQTVTDFYNLMQRFISTSTAEDRAGKLQFEGTVSQALMMMHSDFINRAIRESISRFKKKNMADMIYVFAATLGRPPSSIESAAFGSYTGDLEGIMWILLNSSEFVTIH